MLITIERDYSKREWYWEMSEDGFYASGYANSVQEALQATENCKVGSLVMGSFHCIRCSPDRCCPVYYVNIHPYSAVCKKCGKLVINGAMKADNTPLTLF